MNKAILIAALLATGCAAPQPRIDDAPPAAQPFAFAEETGLLDFAYAYPAEAAAMPTLQARLQADFENVRGEAVSAAESDRSAAPELERPYHQHYVHKTWTSLGESDRLLSLLAHIESYTGGAHGITGFSTLLWDRQTGAPVELLDLFYYRGALASHLRDDFCKALDAERLRRREGRRMTGEFGSCPDFSELTIAPADSDEDGRFDTVQFRAAPYVAGPYVEGEYLVEMPVGKLLVAALEPDFKDSFEAQPQ